MKKVILLFALFAIGIIAFSQEITVRFTGQLNGTDYCRLDRVAVINVTRNWSEMVEYPDTIIVLGGTGDVTLNIAETQGLGQNIPNPFDCETRVELSVSQREDVRMQLLDVLGKIYAEYSGSLDAGAHTFDISAANPQTYLLNAIVGNRQYSIRMVNVGSGCGCSIKYAGCSNGIVAKLTSTNEFLIGDNMRYVGYTTIDGESVASAMVEQMQVISQTVTLNFTHYSSPRVETLSATNITATGATLNGKVTSNGGATVTARGFKYGTSASNLSQNVQSGSGTGNYTKALTGLSSGTTYYYKAYATNSEGTAYGEMMSFTTVAVYLPIVTTGSATNITNSDAILSGNVNDDGGATVTERGFMYGTSESNLSQTIQSGNGTGTYTANITGLSSTTTYYYKAYATNTAGTAYGEVISFSTIAPPSVQTNSASNITTTSATLSGNVTSDGSATVTARGFMYGTNASNLTQTIQSDSGTGSYTANLTGLSSSTTYYYKAYATNTAGTTYGEVMSFTTTAGTGTYNGHEWVDLGLPSGLLWATCNVGANTPSHHGNYYAWGEITTKGTYNWSTYRYCNGSDTTITKYCNNPTYGNNGFTDDLTTLETNDDAATVNWGWGWRMPTKEEIQELIDNCTVTWTTYNNSYGRLFVGPNGNSIFLPTSNYYVDNGISSYNLGCYWSSSRANNYYIYQSPILYINSTGYSISAKDRAWGIPIRAVCPSGSVGVSAPFVITDTIASDVTTTSATISGNVTSDGGAAITDRGFLYGTNSDNLTQIVHSGSGTGSITANLTGLTPITTYYYKAYATNNTGTTYGEVHQFSTNGTYNGYEWVDLGLPSGTLWATCNVGASSPTAYGNYYAWGETTPYTDSYTYSNNPTTLPSSADAATANWCSAWRMPTKAEMEELTNNCTTAWTTQNGVNGRLFIGSNGNSIFLPAAGQPYSAGSVGLYWSSSLYTDSNFAWCLWFGSSSYPVTGGERTIGGSIRPICPAGSTGFSVPIVTTGTVSGITGSGATLSGNITYDCGATVTDRGFIYGTSSSNLSETIHCGNGMGSFTKAITGLSSETTYFYKAYATNTEGTSFGEVRTFTTECNCGAIVTDYDGNTYGSILIGEQCWMTENLRTTHFANGTSIPAGSTTSSTSAYRYNPNDNANNVSTYGYLYNWSAAMNGASSSNSNPSGVQGICPRGWHLPSNAEWNKLINYLSSQNEYQCGDSTTQIAKALASTIGWNSSTNDCAVGNILSDNNSSGFSALPAGTYRGSYSGFGQQAFFWSATEYSTNSSLARNRMIRFDIAIVNSYNLNKGYGKSVRCVKDE